MTGLAESELRVAVLEDQGDGARFLADVCRMLERVAERAGLRLERVGESAPAGAVFKCEGQLPDVLLREIGIHRAQIVPADSVTGRIMTSRVAVERGSASPAQSVVLKTYNYVFARVTRHDTGESFGLSEVLEGRA